MRLFNWKPSNVTYCESCGVETNAKRLCRRCNDAEGEYMHHCDGCGEDYPKTHLIYMNTWNGHFCDRCVVQHTSMRHCDGCGEDFKIDYLEYISQWDGFFCWSCGE
jgi:hypothetical protein